MVGGSLAAIVLILVVPGGIPIVIAAGKKLKDAKRERELAAAKAAVKFQH